MPTGPTDPTDREGVPGSGGRPGSTDGRRSEERLEVVEQLRRLRRYMQAAGVLDRRARSSASPALAGMLRERAEVRWRRAERMRAELAAQGIPRVPPRHRGQA